MPRRVGSASPFRVQSCRSNHQEFRLGCDSGGGPVPTMVRDIGCVNRRPQRSASRT